MSTKYDSPLILNNYPFRVVPSWWTGPTELFHYVVSNDNVGNTIYIDELMGWVECGVPIAEWHLMEAVAARRELGDVVLLPLSNMLSPCFAAPALVDALCEANIPVVLVSIGIQAEANEDPLQTPLSRDARRLLDLSVLQGTIVGVRGQTSLELLQRNGYDNARVIGCVSALTLPSRLHIPARVGRFAMHATLHEQYAPLVRDLMLFGALTQSGWILQSERRMLAELLGVQRQDIHPERLRSDPEMGAIIESRDADARHYFHPDEFLRMKHWFRQCAFFPETRSAWLLRLREFDFALGTRLHGTICALRSGLPSVLVTTDHRTKEVADYHGFPRIAYTRMPAIARWSAKEVASWLLENIEPVAAPDACAAQVDTFRRFLGDNGIRCAPQRAAYENERAQ